MTPDIRPPEPFEVQVETLIVGAGAAGLTAALSAIEAGQEVLVLERDAVPSGSTALSAGLIPAAGTRWQTDAGIDDTPARFAADIQAKAHGQNDSALVDLMTRSAAPTLEWLADRHGLNLSVVTDFDYPGHSRRRMHGLPSRSGADLIDALRAAAEGAGVDILTGARVGTLYAEGGRVLGAGLTRPDGSTDRIGCDRLILACNGYGGNPALVGRHMPQIAGALYFGHPGNQGEAVEWGGALGAELRHLGAYQGHGNVAHPHGILITWATITAGGFQVNRDGVRFWNEQQGYSEAARAVLAQPGGQAVTVFDTRIADIARQFADFRLAEAQGAIRRADTIADLARQMDLPPAALAATLDAVSRSGGAGVPDAFGRVFSGPPLTAPFCAVRVTGALFHTQGGLGVDRLARVRCAGNTGASAGGSADGNAGGGVLPNLFAAGGAACGVSGSGDQGYLSGNGLLAAVTLGRIAGQGPVLSGH